MKRISLSVETVIRWFVFGMLAITFALVIVALFSNDTRGEANTGSFKSEGFNDGWTLEMNGKTKTVSLPTYVDAKEGQMVVIRNTLPEDLSNGCSLMIRSSIEDIYVYINGKLREEYATESVSNKQYYIQGAYVVTELSAKDAGAEIAIHIRIKTLGAINEVRLSYGNNVWFSVMQENMPVTAVAFVVMILGFTLIVSWFIMYRFDKSNRASFYLGLLMVDIGIWAFSESRLRQIIFKKPSLSGYFTYFAVELIGVLAALFFDEVQHKQYHRRYLILESVCCIQLSVNIILNFTHVAELYSTLIFSHVWVAVGLVIVVINVITDFIKKRIRKYSATAVGMLCFLILSLIELATFYSQQFHVYGVFLCIGLVMLAVATVIQVLIDQIIESREREKEQIRKMGITIETIAGTIDAKDEYTGGHSERVGHYVTILARGMADTYHFSEEDIVRIHYIGVVHDIGKIGIADEILNKPGRPDDDEFNLMKRHAEIGAELMRGYGDSVEGLVDGIEFHHERFDGKGYPKGLSGTDIPLIARMISLADCYDAMTSNRVYRRRLTNEQVREELVKGSGTQFDPDLTKIFIHLMDTGEIAPVTVDGMATTETGEVMKSSLLQNFAHRMSESEDTKPDRPNFIRMVCYLIKMKEKNGERTDLFILRFPDSGTGDRKLIIDAARPFVGEDDISIGFNSKSQLVVLFGKTDEQIEDFKKGIQNASADIELATI
ncbi:MAG: HD-GYP domain-containing protein [Candidatus Weimeria sp.]